MFKRQNRLQKQRDFKKIWQKGFFLKNPFFSLRYIYSPRNYSRFSVIVSSKVAAKAVNRNQLKRRMRHILQKHQEKITRPVDMVVVMGKNALISRFTDLEKEFLFLLKKAFPNIPTN